jgi:fermentation-respiration switch protein FrsA (DUF1100 family)
VRRLTTGLVLGCALVSARADAAITKRLDLPLRGKSVAITLYQPQGAPRGTIIVGSGDVGWVGLAVDLSQMLVSRGYIVAGVNVRQYLSAFTSGRQHLDERQMAGDYRAIGDALAREHLLVHPVILSGVSEGAALAVVAAGPSNHDLFDGVITLGVPAVAELAWRWTDVSAWITKRDANEPSFAPFEHIAAVAPLPVVMIQSRKDEYVPEADYTRYFSLAREPKKVVLIDASNHRFTDRLPLLRDEYLAAVAWIADRPAARAAAAESGR